jgi:hypothetical protein
MAEVKKRFRGLSDWLTFELETDAIEPPILKVRLKPIGYFNIAADAIGQGKDAVLNELMFYAAIDAVQEWDLTENGVAIPSTRENKILHLGPRLSDRLKGTVQLFGIAIIDWAANQDNFLKN